jgi:hypothetical protein
MTHQNRVGRGKNTRQQWYPFPTQYHKVAGDSTAHHIVHTPALSIKRERVNRTATADAVGLPIAHACSSFFKVILKFFCLRVSVQARGLFGTLCCSKPPLCTVSRHRLFVCLFARYRSPTLQGLQHTPQLFLYLLV